MLRNLTASLRKLGLCSSCNTSNAQNLIKNASKSLMATRKITTCAATHSMFVNTSGTVFTNKFIASAFQQQQLREYAVKKRTRKEEKEAERKEYEQALAATAGQRVPPEERVGVWGVDREAAYRLWKSTRSQRVKNRNHKKLMRRREIQRNRNMRLMKKQTQAAHQAKLAKWKKEWDRKKAYSELIRQEEAKAAEQQKAAQQ